MKPEGVQYRRLLFAAALLLVVTVSCARYTAKVIVINETSELIETCSIALYGKPAVIKNIKPGEQASVVFDIHSDADYDVTVQFIDGREMHAKVGYVTNGADFRAVISIRPTGIELVNSEME